MRKYLSEYSDDICSEIVLLYSISTKSSYFKWLAVMMLDAARRDSLKTQVGALLTVLVDIRLVIRL